MWLNKPLFNVNISAEEKAPSVLHSRVLLCAYLLSVVRIVSADVAKFRVRGALMLKAGREPSVSLTQSQLSEEDRAKLKVTCDTFWRSALGPILLMDNHRAAPNKNLVLRARGHTRGFECVQHGITPAFVLNFRKWLQWTDCTESECRVCSCRRTDRPSGRWKVTSQHSSEPYVFHLFAPGRYVQIHKTYLTLYIIHVKLMDFNQGIFI